MSLKGWKGKTLRVDLGTGKSRVEETRKDLREGYIGGRGMNARLLYEEVPAGADPLGPENKLFIAPGPLSGTIAPGSQRFTITAKSPLSGFLGDSNGGGYFGAEMKYAGYDCIIVEGVSEKPCYIFIEDGRVEVRDASHLWGKMVGETQGLLRGELGGSDLGIMCIGPAGEKLVKIAGILTDVGRMSARTGMGAVMGSKRLKAIVVRGTGGVEVADNAALERAYRLIVESWEENKEFHEMYKRWGTVGIIPLYNKLGVLPSYNYRQATYPDIDAINQESLFKGHHVMKRACFSCPLACSHTFAVEAGPHAGALAESIQLGPLEHFTSRIGNNDLSLVVRAQQLVNDYGVDVMDMCALIGMAMECYEQGILKKEDLGGLDLTWGNGPAILSLIEMTGSREEGLGDTLAEGLRSAGEKIGKGAERYALHVKGISLSTADPRGSDGWGFAYAVASRGGDHCRSILFCERTWDQALHEELPDHYKALDPYSSEGKPYLVKWHEDLRAAQNCLELCIFTAMYGTAMLPKTQAAVLGAVTGMDLDAAEFMRVGERINNLERAFNVREGLSRKDDTFPERYLKEPLPDGPAKGRVINLEPMLDEYYELRGWEKETGYPKRSKLLELGLGDVASELEAMGRLGRE